MENCQDHRTIEPTVVHVCTYHEPLIDAHESWYTFHFYIVNKSKSKMLTE